MFGEQKSKPIIDGKILVAIENLDEITDIVWQRLRNDDVDLDILANLFESDAFDAFKKKISSQFRRKKWICRNCKTVTSKSRTVRCDGCLDWLHLRCVGLKSPPKSEMWMCPDCQEQN